MRVEQLQTFLAIVETHSFLQAARQCSLTQSTVSRQIQALEADLQCTLFHRSNQAKLTVAGEKLLPHARKICDEWRQASQKISDLLAGKQPEICVAAIHSVCAYFLPPVLQQFCLEYPEVQLRVTALGSDRALKVMRDGLIDVAIVMQNRLFTASADLVVRELYSEPIEVLLASSHPLAKYPVIPWAELVLYPQVVFKDGYGMQRLVQEQFARLGTKLQAVLELNTLDAFRGVVQQGELIALLPRSALMGVQQEPSLAVRKIEPLPLDALPSGKEVVTTLRRQVMLVTTTDRILLPPIASFCQLVQARAEKLGLLNADPDQT
jgi:DNA-binding transcriptional LysR family regulator